MILRRGLSSKSSFFPSNLESTKHPQCYISLMKYCQHITHIYVTISWRDYLCCYSHGSFPMGVPVRLVEDVHLFPANENIQGHSQEMTRW